MKNIGHSDKLFEL